MPTWDVINQVLTTMQLGIQAAELGFLGWLFAGGIVYLIRSISFIIDTFLVGLIARMYVYFKAMIEGTLFNDNVINSVMTRVYIFIGVVIFFRLVMVLLRYIVNPELVADGKQGANQLIKRVIIGMMGIILVPTIFSFANKLQSSFLKDEVIQQIIIPEDMLAVTKSNVSNAGLKIGSYIMFGFLNPSNTASEATINKYNLAVQRGNIAALDYDAATKGGFFGLGYGGYEYNYLFILSTIFLGYTLYLIVKYCLDLAVRFLKLFVCQILAPFAMIEYMINGSQDGVFKNWKNTVLGSYFMIFTRVFALWFTVFIMSLMSGNLSGSKYTSGTLLASNDGLLRAIIIIAVLAFMKDLPKILSSIFGLDLEQESSATGLLKTVTGSITKLANVGLGFAGGVLGGFVGKAKGIGMAAAEYGAQRSENPNATDAEKADMRNKFFNKGASILSKPTGANALKSGLSQTKFGSVAIGAYNNAKQYGATESDYMQAYKAEKKKIKHEEEEKQKEALTARFRDKVLDEVGNVRQSNLYANDTAAAGRLIESPGSRGKDKETISRELGEGFKTQAEREIGSYSYTDNGGQVRVGIDGIKADLASSTTVADFVNKLNSSFGRAYSMSSPEIEAVVNPILSNGALTSQQRIDQVISSVQQRGEAKSYERADRAVDNYLSGDTDVDSHRTNTTVENIERHVNTINTTTNVIRDDIENSTPAIPSSVRRNRWRLRGGREGRNRNGNGNHLNE